MGLGLQSPLVFLLMLFRGFIQPLEVRLQRVAFASPWVYIPAMEVPGGEDCKGSSTNHLLFICLCASLGKSLSLSLPWFLHL